MANVTGPASSTDTAIARWNGTSGTVIEDSAVTVDGAGNISGVASLAGSPTTTTQSPGDNSTKIATTAFVATAVGGKSGAVVYSVISGFLPSSIAGTHTTASFTLSAGQAADSTNAAYITKSSTTSWAASNGNAINGTDAASATLANSTTYHIFMCSGASGTGSFVSASLTPTFPSGYNTYYRRVSSFNTNSSGAPLPYTAIEIEGGATLNYLTTAVLDINAISVATTGTQLTMTSVPTGIKMGWLHVAGTNSSGGHTISFFSGDETGVQPVLDNSYTFPLWQCAGYSGGEQFSMLNDGILTTNTSA